MHNVIPQVPTWRSSSSDGFALRLRLSLTAWSKEDMIVVSRCECASECYERWEMLYKAQVYGVVNNNKLPALSRMTETSSTALPRDLQDAPRKALNAWSRLPPNNHLVLLSDLTCLQQQKHKCHQVLQKQNWAQQAVPRLFSSQRRQQGPQHSDHNRSTRNISISI